MRSFLLLALSFIAISVQSQQWVVSYPVTEGVILIGGDGNENGNYIVGACEKAGDLGYQSAYAMYIDNDGNHKETKIGFHGYKAYLCKALCLDDGNALAVGVKGGTNTDYKYDTLWIAVMNPDLEIVEEHNYPLIEPYKTWTTDIYMAFNKYGEVIVLADVSERDYPFVTNGVYVVFKCDIHGNVLKSQYFPDGHGVDGARPTGLVRVPNSDYMMMMGKGFMTNNYSSICYIDNDLNKVSAYPLHWLEDKWNYSDCWKENGHFLMSSLTHHYGMSGAPYYAAVFEVDDKGQYIDTLVYDRADTSDYTAQYGSMAYYNDELIYIATYWENGLNEQPSDAVICLIDKELNLRGTKRLVFEDTKIRIMHCQTTNDGGCLVYGQCKVSHGSEMACVWKLVPEDFMIPWTLGEPPEVLPHQTAYPNPTSGLLNLSIEGADNQRYMVCVTDARGHKYFERRFEDRGGLLTLDVSSLEKGLYFYEIRDGHCTRKGKFIKK